MGRMAVDCLHHGCSMSHKAKIFLLAVVVKTKTNDLTESVLFDIF